MSSQPTSRHTDDPRPGQGDPASSILCRRTTESIGLSRADLDERVEESAEHRQPGGGGMSPRWAEVAGYSLYLYFEEPHQRPHVAVRQGRSRVATVDLLTGELLAGDLPPTALRAVQKLLEEHRGEAVAAFERTLRHDFPGRLGEGGE